LSPRPRVTASPSPSIHKIYLSFGRYFLGNFHEKTVLAVTILLRKVARCILGTRNLVLTLLRRQREKHS
ncbi:MAG TPA: hypothetical protein VK203_18880, partial [Nostocaceae cyanobacterium]|nr:hypothetical protein [Nostocaceae cyanobacterium]